ncbi:MAG TPA: ABC transporter permease, partial [Candidatus Solibacter sp.]|nr:ABC transporter permease [Candidatus Solibacter sp.]
MKYAVRLFARNPAFAAVAVLTMAVGVGAITAIFSVANALLLRPLPYAQPDRLVLLSSELKAAGVKQGPLTYPRFTLVNERSRSFTGVAAFCAEVFNLTGRGDPEQIQAARVSWNFFDILGVHPALGRPFRAEEDQPAGAPVALIGNALWARRFASDPSAVGRSVTLDSKDYTIIGVLPPDFRFALLGLKAEIFAPRVFDLNIITPEQARAGTGFLNYVARLQPGTGIAGAQREMNALSAQYRREFPKFPDTDPDLIVRVGNLRDEMVSGVRPAVLILFGAVTLVLLIACANVASLLLSRALGRKREIAVRAAIGASRAALIRQLLTESLMLAVLGGLLGALLSAWGTHALAGMAQGSLPRASEIRTDGYVMAFTLLVSMLAGILFGLAPALQISRADLNSVLRSEGRGAGSGGGGGRRRNVMRNLLVVSQVALSMLLVIASGLLLRNFAQLRSRNPGFDPHNLLTLNVALPPARYSKPAQMAAFFSELVRQVRAVPGVGSAAGSSALPVNPSRFSPALPEGQPQLPLSQRPVFNIQMPGPGYAATLRIPVARGREFTERDDAHAPLVAMVNQSLARRYWPNENAVGKHILLGRIPQPLEVVGVLGDVRNLGVAADVGLEIYIPFAQRPWANINLIVRTAGDPHAFVSAVRARVLSIDADQPVTAVQTMEELLETGAAQSRFTASLLGALSGTALLLAVVGIYSVIAYSVAERTHEMGIRIALGAEPADILRMVLRQGLLLALSGIVIGVAASFALTRLMASLLYHVSVTDPATFAIGSLLFAAVALLASYLPARRA